MVFKPIPIRIKRKKIKSKTLIELGKSVKFFGKSAKHLPKRELIPPKLKRL